MAMRFDVRDHIGYFIYPDTRFDAAHEAFETLHQRSMSYPRYTAVLTGLIAQQPDFIDLHVQLAHAYQHQGKPKKVRDAALRPCDWQPLYSLRISWTDRLGSTRESPLLECPGSGDNRFHLNETPQRGGRVDRKTAGL